MRVLMLRSAALAGLAVALGCGWFAGMELLLRHPRYLWRALVAGAIVAEAAITIAMVEDVIEASGLRWPLTVAAAASACLGGLIIAADLARPGVPAANHFEGYLLIAGLALVSYGGLTIAALALD